MQEIHIHNICFNKAPKVYFIYSVYQTAHVFVYPHICTRILVPILAVGHLCDILLNQVEYYARTTLFYKRAILL